MKLNSHQEDQFHQKGHIDQDEEVKHEIKLDNNTKE